MLIACVIAYNEEQMLPGCLATVARQADRIIVVDGRYEMFPDFSHENEDGRSSDATVAIARAFGAEVIMPPGRPWRTQMEKRSAYLLGDEGDWYFRIDADERLQGSIPLADLDGAHSYALQICWHKDTILPWVACLFQQRGQMYYQGSHCALFRDGDLISRGADAIRLDEARLIHLKEFRDAERKRAKIQYYAWQTPAERAFREGHHV